MGESTKASSGLRCASGRNALRAHTFIALATLSLHSAGPLSICACAVHKVLILLGAFVLLIRITSPDLKASSQITRDSDPLDASKALSATA